MTSNHVDVLHEAYRQFLAQVPPARRVLIGYSGGMDSHVLLHLAQCCQSDRPDLALCAVHVDHGIHADSGQWARHCEAVCADLDLPFRLMSVTVTNDASVGPEASARRARYGQFSQAMQEGDYLILAQHADDQAETFLLQALRGSGPDGLASIPRRREFAGGWLCRPLLACTQQQLSDYASLHGLRWIEDPSNQDDSFDRNFLRQQVLPLVASRWPALNHTLSRSASRCGAASQLLLSMASEELSLTRTGSGNELDVGRLRALGQERMYNVLRLWVRENGYPLPALKHLKQVESDLLHSDPDTVGRVSLGEFEFRRFKQHLFLLPPQPAPAAFMHEWLPPYADLHIPEIDLTLTREDCIAQGLLLPERESVLVQSRAGGELIRIGEPAFHKSVKKVLQESRVPPWVRDRVPLLYVGGRLAAVWQVIVANDFRAEKSVTI